MSGKFDARKTFNKTANRWEVYWYDENKKRHNSTYAKWAWEMNYGDVPKGYRVSYKDGNPLNIELDNLELISPQIFGERISERLMGHALSDETKAKISKAHTGKVLSEEHRENLSKHMKHQWADENSTFRSDEYLEKLRGKPAWNRGMKHLDSTRKKISDANKNRWKDLESRKQMSEKLKSIYENPDIREKVSKSVRKAYAETDLSDRLSKIRKEWHSIPENAESHSDIMKSVMTDPNIRYRISLSMKGREFTDEHRSKLSKSRLGRFTGPECKFWRGGKSAEQNPYPKEFSRYLKRKVRSRDHHICQACLQPAIGWDGVIHHISGDKQDCSMDNLVLVCRCCHNSIHGNSKISNDKIDMFRSKLKE